MKKRLIFTLIIIVAVCGIASSCAGAHERRSGVEVVYELEGGIYNNCGGSIKHYYPFESDSENAICEPQTLSGKEITRSGFYIEGWYRTKTGEGDLCEYDGRWDFSNDKVDSSGVTLYARWLPVIKYTYEVCYRNEESGEREVLGSYVVSAGDKYNDFKKISKRGGYTAIATLDKDGNPWDPDFVHPGGESSFAVEVYYEYVKGSFKVVTTAAELAAAGNSNIYLKNDVDMAGAALNFGDYTATFAGNGHTVSNAVIKYGNSVNNLIEDYEDGGLNSIKISLFGDASNATVKDVTFTGLTVNIEAGLSRIKHIYFSPLFVRMNKCTVSNVTVNGTYTVGELPDGFEIENLIVVADGASVYKDATTVTENCTVNVTAE